MDPSAIGDELNDVSVLVNVAHRLLLGLREEVDTDPSYQAVLDDINAAHDQLDLALESIGRAMDRMDQEADRPREQRPAIH